jgi:ribonuclease BN (tRNA processing enzyme)
MWSTRRQTLGGLASALLPLQASRAQPALAAGPDRLVLLGARGGPLVTGYTPGPSANVVVFRGEPYVVDAGYGVSAKLTQAGVPLASLRRVFITHHHSDHNLELGNLLYNAWVGGLRTPVDVYGPRGLDELLAGFWASNRFDIETRVSDEGRPDPRRLVAGHEFAQGVIHEGDGVRVTALRNRHPPIQESFAFKLELGAQTVVFSGDTAYFPPLAEFARGAEYLVHEVLLPGPLDAMLSRRPNAARLRQSILSHHTTAEEVGRIATAAKVRTLVLNHFVPGDDPALTPEVWAQAVRPTFSGEIVVGRDLLSLPL